MKEPFFIFIVAIFFPQMNSFYFSTTKKDKTNVLFIIVDDLSNIVTNKNYHDLLKIPSIRDLQNHGITFSKTFAQVL